MSVLGSGESVVLLVCTLIAFRIMPDLAKTLVGVKDTGGLDHVLKLMLVLVVSAILISMKWWITKSASLTLFSLLFTVGAGIMIFRFLLAVGVVASFKRFSADPLALLAEVVVGVAIGIASAIHGYTSPLATGMMASNNVVFVLLMLFIFLFRPSFAFHELLDGKYFPLSANPEIVTSSVKGVNSIRKIGSWSVLVGRWVVAGSAPIIIFLMVFQNKPLIMAVMGILISVSGLILSRPLADFWALIESIRHASASQTQTLKLSDVGLNYAILVTPYVGLFLVSLASLVSLAFVSFVDHNTSGMLERYTFLPDRIFVQDVADLAVNLWLLVACVQAIVTVGYKRVVAHMKSYMNS